MRAREADPLDARRRRRTRAGARRTRCDSSGARSRPQELTFWPSSVISRTPLVGEPRHLGDDLARPPALLAAAHGRDDAVRARRSCSPSRPAPRPGSAARGASAGRPRSARACRSGRARRAYAAGADPLAEVRDRARARRRRRRTGRARRSAPAAPRRSSRRRRSRRRGRARFRAPALPRYAASLVSGFSRIVQVLKTMTSASSGDGRLAEPERLEHALDPLRVVRVHLAAERRDVVPTHRGQG